jgi:hypothetical protein
MQNLCGAEDFFDEQDKTVKNLAQTERLRSKKYFELYRQILIKFVTNVGISFIHSASMKVRKMKPRVQIMLKRALFLPTIPFEETSNEIFEAVWKKENIFYEI